MSGVVASCLLCGKRASGRVYTDWAGQCICTAHPESEVHVCHSCGRLCAPDARPIGYGLWLCSTCQKGRMTQAQAQGVVDYIRNGYRQAGLGEIRGWTLKVSDLNTMARVCGSPNVKGYAHKSRSGYEVFILRDLSKLFFAHVLAHELLHIWQYHQGLYPEQQLCEGFCNLGSYYVLEHIGGAEAEAQMKLLCENPDPIYGDGFRIIKKQYDKGGWPAATQYIRQSSDKPKRKDKIWQRIF